MPGKVRNTKANMLERFWARVKKAESCWWYGTKNAYNKFGTFNGKEVLAHRFSYELHKGKIPRGLVVDHLCRNPGCVNPAHLEAVTSGTNVVRGENPAAVNALKTHCIHGHEFSAENTMIKPDGDRQCRACYRIEHKRNRLRRTAAIQAVLDRRGK